ncbi:MAG: hypothetical protein KGH63_03785, partial [Candidatus Micrarchaeota archaeon]|nr:hypothetical protein [Candidatus Micrarchaeota archaeon]
TSNTFGGQVEVVHLHILDTADQMAANIAQAEAAHEKVKDLTPSPVPRIKPLSQMLKEAQQNEPAEQQRLETQKRTQTPPAQTVTPPSTTVQEPGLTPPPVEKPKPVLAPPVDQSALSVSGAPNQMPDQRSSQIAANFEGYYSNQVESIRQKFDELGRWANWDDLRVLTQDYAAINNLKIDLDQQLANQRDPAVRKQYQDRLKADLSDIRSGLPEYLRGSINERGAIDLGQLKSATDSLKAAVQALNVFETDAGKTMLQAQPSAADLSRLQGEFDQLQYSYSNQLSFIMIQRYGPTGEGLSSTREFLGLAPSSDDAGLQYLAIMRDLLTDPAGRTLIEGQWAQFQSKYAQSVDPATGARVSQTAQTLAASTTTVYDAQQNPDGSYSDVLSTRATYDPLGTLMFLRNANRPDMLISDDNVLNEVVRAASLSSLFNTAAIPSTSGAPAQQSNSNSQMPSGLWSQLASDEKFMDLAGRTGDASTQVQLVTSASLLLSRIQSTPAFAYDVRYDKRALLLSKFDGLSLTGNETTDLESKIYYGLPQGHVGIVSPYDFIAKYFPTDYTALGDFARGMWRPVSLWSSTLVPQVQREGQLQQTDLNYLFDLQSYYTRQFYSYMPTARYIQFSYGQNYLGLRANYGMLLGQMNEFFNDVVGTAPISYSPRRYTGQFAAGGSEASTALDAQYYAPGKVIGQQVYADAFYRGATTPGSTYDLSKQTYLPYEASYQREFDAKLLASQMEGLNTRLWQALGTWSQTSANPNEQGGVAGLPLATFSRDVNL